jgi:hypothetical protein
MPLRFRMVLNSRSAAEIDSVTRVLDIQESCDQLEAGVAILMARLQRPPRTSLPLQSFLSGSRTRPQSASIKGQADSRQRAQREQRSPDHGIWAIQRLALVRVQSCGRASRMKKNRPLTVHPEPLPNTAVRRRVRCEIVSIESDARNRHASFRRGGNRSGLVRRRSLFRAGRRPVDVTLRLGRTDALR